MSHRDDLLKDAIERKTDPAFLTGRAAVVDAYQDKYGSSWKTHIVNDILALKPDAKRASVQREFQYDKRTGQERYKNERVTGSTKGRYESLGKTLPSIGRKLKGDSITIKVTGNQDIYKNGKKTGSRKRDIEVTFSGTDAQSFIDDPTYVSIWEGYDVDPDLFEDGDYAIDVYAVA